MDDVNLVPADRLTRRQLIALFNAAYRDYFVPVAFDQATMQRHLTDN